MANFIWLTASTFCDFLCVKAFRPKLSGFGISISFEKWEFAEFFDSEFLVPYSLALKTLLEGLEDLATVRVS